VGLRGLIGKLALEEASRNERYAEHGVAVVVVNALSDKTVRRRLKKTNCSHGGSRA
jgi:hypothetical protein